MKYFICTSLMVILISFTFTNVVFATSFSTDKTSYQTGQNIIIKGKITQLQEGQFVGLRILNPSKSDIVTVDQFLPQKDGSFSKSYKADGPKWIASGTYTIDIFYGDDSFTKTIQFQKQVQQESPASDKTKSSQVESENLPKSKPDLSDNSEKQSENRQNPKLLVHGFPDTNKSPQYYIDRYENEPQYRDWIQNTFPGISMEELVEYPKTSINDFPNNTNSPQYYLNRYNNEPKYKEWFESQFPDSTIFDVLGYPESLFHKVPNWIKNNAKWWAEGLIDDSNFLSGIEYMIKENIVVIGEIPESKTASQKVPEWVKNTANWWANDLIDEGDFVLGLQFLIENGIIKI